MSTLEEYAIREGMQFVELVLEPEIRDLLLEFGTHFRPEKYKRGEHQFELILMIVNRPGLNAIVGAFDDVDAVIFYRDVYRLLLGGARGVLSQERIRLHEGASVQARKLPGTLSQLAAGKVQFENIRLEDDRYEEIALRIAKYSMFLIMAHEWFHITGGHCDWLRAWGQTTIAEVDGELEAQLDGYERETLEWDADSLAMGFLAAVALEVTVENETGSTVWTIPETNRSGSVQDALSEVLIAAMIVCVYFRSSDGRDVRSEKPAIHPHRSLRWKNFVGTLLTNLSYRTGCLIEEAIKMLPDFGFSKSVSQFFELPLSEVSQQEIHEIMGRRLIIYTETWARLQPELERYKRGGTLAPAVPQPHPNFPENPLPG